MPSFVTYALADDNLAFLSSIIMNSTGISITYLFQYWYPRPDLNRHELSSTDFKSIMSTIPSRGHKLERQYYSKKYYGASTFFALKFGNRLMLPKFINLAKMAYDSYPELGLL